MFMRLYKCVSGTGHISLTHPFTCCIFLSLFCLPYSVSSLFSAPACDLDSSCDTLETKVLFKAERHPDKNIHRLQSTVFIGVGRLLSTRFRRKIHKRGKRIEAVLITKAVQRSSWTLRSPEDGQNQVFKQCSATISDRLNYYSSTEKVRLACG